MYLTTLIFFYFPELLNAKALFVKEQYCYYLTHSLEDKTCLTFLKSTAPKMDVIAWLEFNPTVQHVNHYTTEALTFSL